MAQLPNEGAFGDYAEWPGRAVLDSGGDRLGGVREIYLDRETGRPEWVLVEVEDGEPRFVPLADAEVEAESIRLAHPASVVRAAPAIGPDAQIDNEQERRLYAHYGLGYSEDAWVPGLPTDEPPGEERDPAGPPEAAEARGDAGSPAAADDAPAPAGEPSAAADVPPAGTDDAPATAAEPSAAADVPPAADEPLPGAAAPLGAAGDEAFSEAAGPSEDAPVAGALGAPRPGGQALHEGARPPQPEPPRAFPPPPPPPPPEPGGGSLPVLGTHRRLGLAGAAALLAALLFLVVRKLRG